MKRKEMLRGLLAPDLSDDESPAAGPSHTPRVPSGAVRAMGLSLGRLADDARRAEELQKRLEDGQAVVEVDPAAVEPSFASDRISRVDDADYRRLVESIRQSGQQVPALLRPHPDGPDRYQVAYGHRRLAACAELGIGLRAIVRSLSDAELVVAQGKENAERRNLSFIERALFAANLEARGFERSTLCAALAAHPAEVTRYLAVARAVPRRVVLAVGPAPRAGRPRWMELAKLLAAPGAESVLDPVLERSSFQQAGSDARFQALLVVLRAVGPRTAPDEAVVRNTRGVPVVRVERAAGRVRVLVLEGADASVAEFLLARLPAVLAEYGASDHSTSTRWRG